MHCVNPFQTGGGGVVRKVPALTLNVYNFVNRAIFTVFASLAKALYFLIELQTIADRGSRLWNPVNIKAANKEAKMEDGRSTTVYIFCFSLIHYA